MNSIAWYLAVTLAVALATDAAVESQPQILRRVIKSTPTATQLTRVRAVSVRSNGPERGGVSEISSHEANNFGRRSFHAEQAPVSSPLTAIKTTEHGNKKEAASTTAATPASSTTTAASTTTSTTSTTTNAPSTTELSSSTGEPVTTTTQLTPSRPERQRAPSGSSLQGGEVELLASSPSSWQAMSAVEAPAAALIMAGPRSAQASSNTVDLSSSSSELDTSSSSDFLRSSGSKGYSSAQLVGDTFSRLRQQASKTSQQQQTSYFYPQPQQLRSAGKTSQYQATKTHWYQPPTTTTPRPAPIIQEPQYEQQQSEQYVEQQQQVEGAAPPGYAEPFAFDFNTQDQSGNGQYRKEESDSNGVVRGSYGYTDANGIYRHVEYVADQNGFRANIKSNEPGLIGETQPASIRLDGAGAGAASAARPASSPAANNQRLTAEAAFSASAGTDDWSRNGDQGDSVASAPPDFESSHRVRARRNYRNL